MRETVLTVFATVLGAIIGSFLNACIHRLPRDLSLAEPKRSFCPSCHRTIPWYENLPIVSWLFLRGRCAGCGLKIPFRYLLVEVVTATLFYYAWTRFGMPLAPVYWLFLAIMVCATFIDIEHFIIPDILTWGGATAGLVLSLLVPSMMETDSRWQALLWSLLGAVLGFGILWLIVEGGKLAFGRKKHAFDPEETFVWKRDGDTAVLTIGEEALPWSEIFFRASDELLLDCSSLSFDGQPAEPKVLRFRYDVLLGEDKRTPLEEWVTIEGKVRAVTIPREAMGFGDEKFMAAIGAFLGWKAILFTLCAASIIGCLAAVAGIFLARDRAGSRVPFGPFLALGAVIWIFGGKAIWDWYFGMFGGGDPSLVF